MQFEVIRKSHKKSIVIGVSLFIVLAIVLIVRFTFAKYSLVKSIKIAEGTINYKVPDFKIMAMYKNDGSGYTEIETMPESGYAINESKSYCTLDNVNKDTEARLYTDEDGQHVISGLSKYDKCYLYFDDYKKVKTSLGEITVKLATPDFSKTSCSSGCEEATVGIYQAKDDDGMSYYYRGDVNNNYVKFANKWWRIIRINGDGSIRLIYDGTSAHQNGEVTEDSIAVTSVKFSHKDAYYYSSSDNAYVKDNAYVGFKYTVGTLRGLGTKSNALTQLETWYTSNLSSYASKLDINAGFCGDRTPSTSKTETNNLGGTGTTETYYGASIRLVANKAPMLTCAYASDLYTTSISTKGNNSLTYPIGLITADEVSMTGGLSGTLNPSYYLYNGQHYWTLSPYNFSGTSAGLFFVNSAGYLHSGGVSNSFDVRPVINLKSDTKFTGKGTTSDPYVVS